VNIGKLPPGNNKRDHSSGKCVPNVSTATKQAAKSLRQTDLQVLKVQMGRLKNEYKRRLGQEDAEEKQPPKKQKKGAKKAQAAARAAAAAAEEDYDDVFLSDSEEA
jgi:hypothetical protein